MNKKKIVSLLLIVSLFMIILPGFSIAVVRNNISFGDYATSIPNGRSEIRGYYVRKYNVTQRYVPGTDAGTGNEIFLPTDLMIGQVGKYIDRWYTSNSQSDASRILVTEKLFGYPKYHHYKVNLDTNGTNHYINNNYAKDFIMAYSAKADDVSDESSRVRSHSIAQWAWSHINGVADYYDINQDNKEAVDELQDGGNDLIDSALEYQTRMKSIDAKLKQKFGNDVNFYNAKEKGIDLDSVISEIFSDPISFDITNATVSVVHENQDYIMVSGLRTEEAGSFTHKDRPDSEGKWHCNKIDTLIDGGYIRFKVQDDNGVVHFEEDKYKIDFTPEEANCDGNGVVTNLVDRTGVIIEYATTGNHITRTENYYQHSSTCYCEVHGTVKKFTNSEYYPFPLRGDRFNIKIPANYILNNGLGGKIVGIQEISFSSSNSNSTISVSPSIVKFDKLSTVKNNDGSVIHEHQGRFRRFNSSWEEPYMYVQQESVTTASLMNINEENNGMSTYEMMAMPEKFIDDFGNDVADTDNIASSLEIINPDKVPNWFRNAQKGDAAISCNEGPVQYTVKDNGDDSYTIYVIGDSKTVSIYTKESYLYDASTQSKELYKAFSEYDGNRTYQIELGTSDVKICVGYNSNGGIKSSKTFTIKGLVSQSTIDSYYNNCRNANALFDNNGTKGSLTYLLKYATSPGVFLTTNGESNFNLMIDKVLSDIDNKKFGFSSSITSDGKKVAFLEGINAANTIQKECPSRFKEQIDNIKTKLNSEINNLPQLVNIVSTTGTQTGYVWLGANQSEKLSGSGSTLTFTGNAGDVFTIGMAGIKPKNYPGADIKTSNGNTYDFIARTSGTYTWTFTETNNKNKIWMMTVKITAKTDGTIASVYKSQPTNVSAGDVWYAGTEGSKITVNTQTGKFTHSNYDGNSFFTIGMYKAHIEDFGGVNVSKDHITNKGDYNYYDIKLPAKSAYTFKIKTQSSNTLKVFIIDVSQGSKVINKAANDENSETVTVKPCTDTAGHSKLVSDFNSLADSAKTYAEKNNAINKGTEAVKILNECGNHSSDIASIKKKLIELQNSISGDGSVKWSDIVKRDDLVGVQVNYIEKYKDNILQISGAPRVTKAKINGTEYDAFDFIFVCDSSSLNGFSIPGYENYYSVNGNTVSFDLTKKTIEDKIGTNSYVEFSYTTDYLNNLRTTEGIDFQPKFRIYKYEFDGTIVNSTTTEEGETKYSITVSPGQVKDASPESNIGGISINKSIHFDGEKGPDGTLRMSGGIKFGTNGEIDRIVTEDTKNHEFLRVIVDGTTYNLTDMDLNYRTNINFLEMLCKIFGEEENIKYNTLKIEYAGLQRSITIKNLSNQETRVEDENKIIQDSDQEISVDGINLIYKAIGEYKWDKPNQKSVPFTNDNIAKLEFNTDGDLLIKLDDEVGQYIDTAYEASYSYVEGWDLVKDIYYNYGNKYEYNKTTRTITLKNFKETIINNPHAYHIGLISNDGVSQEPFRPVIYLRNSTDYSGNNYYEKQKLNENEADYVIYGATYDIGNDIGICKKGQTTKTNDLFNISEDGKNLIVKIKILQSIKSIDEIGNFNTSNDKWLNAIGVKKYVDKANKELVVSIPINVITTKTNMEGMWFQIDDFCHFVVDYTGEKTSGWNHYGPVNIDGFSYEVINNRYDLNISIPDEAKKIYAGYLDGNTSAQFYQSPDKYKRIVFPMSIPEGFSLNIEKSKAKSNVSNSVDIKEHQYYLGTEKYLEIDNGLPMQGETNVHYYIIFTNNNGDEISSEIIINKEDRTIVNKELSSKDDRNPNGNIWISSDDNGASYTDIAEYLKDEDGNSYINNIMTIGKASDSLNNKNMKKYFKDGTVEDGRLKDDGTLSEVLKDYGYSTPLNIDVTSEDIQTIRIDKPGFLKGTNGDHYVNINLQLEGALYYEVNYRYDRDFKNINATYKNDADEYVPYTYEDGRIVEVYAGDGYADEVIGQNKLQYITPGNQYATFKIERAGFTVLTVTYNDGGVQNIFIYVPPINIGASENTVGGHKQIVKYDGDNTHNTSDLIAKAAQFEIEVYDQGNTKNTKNSKLVFYNVSDESNLGNADTMMAPDNQVDEKTGEDVIGYKYYPGSGDNFTTSADFFEQMKTGVTSFKLDASVAGRFNRRYYAEGGVIEGFTNEDLDFGDAPLWNGEGAIPANFYSVEDDDGNVRNELRWSYRDYGLTEATNEGGTYGSTLFTIIFKSAENTPTPSNNDAELVYINTIEEYEIKTKPSNWKSAGWNFTMNIEGKVWLDSEIEKNNGITAKKGLYDGTDTSLDGQVRVYISEIDKNGNEIERKYDKTIDGFTYNLKDILPPLSTNSNRHYYNVRFEYNGQKYEPVEFLATQPSNTDNIGNTYNSSIIASRQGNLINNLANTNLYKNSSWAYETDRNSFDDYLTTIGKDAKQGKDQSGNDIPVTYEYTDNKASNNSYHPISASTGINIPANDEPYHLRADKSGPVYVRLPVDSGENHNTIQGYSKHINLGLTKRDETDLSVVRDVYKAKVVINEQDIDHNYNQLIDLKKDDDGDIIALNTEYDLGLYSSDINYSSNVYSSASDAIKAIKKGTELRAFITYRVSIYNSGSTIASVNNLSEYVRNDSNLSLVDNNQIVNLLRKSDPKNYTEFDLERKQEVVAYSPYYRIVGDSAGLQYYYDKTADMKAGRESGDNISFNDSGEVSGYHRYTTNNLSHDINPGERLDLFITYEVDKDGYREVIDNAFNGNPGDVREGKLKGDKITLSEIDNYSTKYVRRKNETSAYSKGDNSGKIDRDSQPENAFESVKAGQTLPRIEDDTSNHGTLKVKLRAKQDEIRSISGNVWEDENHDGKYDSKGIEKIDVSLIEKIPMKDGEYEFAWKIDDDNKTQTDVFGGYSIYGVVPGIYSVRFEYGTPAQNKNYSGQDYKNTSYQEGKNTDLNQRWQDIRNLIFEKDSNGNYIEPTKVNPVNSAENRVSDARDYEPARLRTIAYSRTISNLNDTALDNGTQNTYMRADTANLYMEVEDPSRVEYNDYGNGYVKTFVDPEGEFIHEYKIDTLDFGLEERPKTSLQLDKKLTEITLTKLDGTETIFHAKFNPNDSENPIDYETGISIDKMTSIDNASAAQGFRYIQMEDSYLNNLGINLKYDIFVTNNSETDRVGEELAKLTTMESIYDKASDMEKSTEYKFGRDIDYGKLLGKDYYTHDGSGTVVTTTIDQVVDYIDKDIGLDSDENENIENHAWEYANIAENTTPKYSLNGLLSDDSFNNDEDLVVYDNGTGGEGVSYFGSGKSNLVLSKNENIQSMQSGDTLSDIEYTTNMKDITGNNLYIEVKYDGPSGVPAVQARYKGTTTKGTYNPELTKTLMPKDVAGEHTASIGISVSKTVSSGTDTNDLKFDNLAEILVYSNTAGRADRTITPGNANKIAKESGLWAAGHSANANNEKDADAPEYVTLTPPTGLSEQMETSNNMLIVTIVAVATALIASITVPIVTILYDRGRKTVEEDEL